MASRFLSPDPYVQAPDFSQSFNRYAYVWNNPLKYTDPSGYRTHYSRYHPGDIPDIPRNPMEGFCPSFGGFNPGMNSGFGGGFGNPVGGGDWIRKFGKLTYYQLKNLRYWDAFFKGTINPTHFSWNPYGGVELFRWSEGRTTTIKFSGIYKSKLAGFRNSRGFGNSTERGDGTAGGWSDTYNFNRIGFVPLDEKVGYQMANYRMNFRASTSMVIILGKDYSIQGQRRVLTISAVSSTTLVSGDVSASARATLIVNENTISSQSFLSSGTHLVDSSSYYIGSVSFSIPDSGNIQVRLNGGWVVTGFGGRSVPVNHPIVAPTSININTTISIPSL